MCLPFVNSADELIVAAEENTGNKAHSVSCYTLRSLMSAQGRERIMDVEKETLVFSVLTFSFFLNLAWTWCQKLVYSYGCEKSEDKNSTRFVDILSRPSCFSSCFSSAYSHLTTEEKKNPKSWHNSGLLSLPDSAVSEAAENSTGSPKEFPVHKNHIKICILSTMVIWTAEEKLIETSGIYLSYCQGITAIW